MSAGRGRARGRRRRAGAAMAVLLLGPVAGCLAAPPAPPTPTKPSAVVLEFADPLTQRHTGAAKLLEQAGFVVEPLDTGRPANETGADLIVFGSFVSESPTYRQYIRTYGESLVAFVEAGGVVVQLAQVADTEPGVPFLPAGMKAERCNDDLARINVLTPTHPLCGGFILTRSLPPQLRLPAHLNRLPNSDSLAEFEGFGVLMASDHVYRRPALIEGAHGRGRFVITSLSLDKLYDAEGRPDAPEALAAAARIFFANLRRYVELVKNGTAPSVVPTRAVSSAP